MGFGKHLIEQLRAESVDQIDWFSRSGPVTTSDVLAYLVTHELNQLDAGDELTDEEADDLILRLRGRVIPIISNFLDVDLAMSRSQLTGNTT